MKSHNIPVSHLEECLALRAPVHPCLSTGAAKAGWSVHLGPCLECYTLLCSSCKSHRAAMPLGNLPQWFSRLQGWFLPSAISREGR